MINRNIQMKKKNNGQWENLFPLTLDENIFNSEGKSLEKQIKDFKDKNVVNIALPPYSVKENTDITNALNNAISDLSVNYGGGTIYIPYSKKSYLIDAIETIKLKDNIHIILDCNTVLDVIPNSATNYSVFNIDNVHNVLIEGGSIKGDRYNHQDSSGEWGLGIKITNSNNITIKNLKTSNMWGDGLYISGTSQNVLIDNVVSDNNRRQGISIVGGKNISIMNSVFSNTNGTKPESGIDIEPNTGKIVNSVTISNCFIKENVGVGIMSTANPNGRSEDIIIKDNYISSNSRGIWLGTETHNIIISNNIIKNNGDYGVYGKPSKNSKASGINIDSNIIENNGENIHLFNIDKYVNISNNSVNNGMSGIYMRENENVVINGNTFNKNSQLFTLYVLDDIHITNNNIKGTSYIGLFDRTTYMLFSGNKFETLERGIDFHGLQNSIISNNLFKTILVDSSEPLLYIRTDGIQNNIKDNVFRKLEGEGNIIPIKLGTTIQKTFITQNDFTGTTSLNEIIHDYYPYEEGIGNILSSGELGKVYV